MMRATFVFVLCLLAAHFASAQDSAERYGAGISGDTVKIWNVNILSLCLSQYTASVTLPKDSIVVIEKDTASYHARCFCYYDVNVALTGLKSGNYQIVLYRNEVKQSQSGKDTLVLVASFSFSVGGIGTQAPSTAVRTTDCHQTLISPEQEHGAINKYFLLTSYPNPFNPTTSVQYSIPQAELVTLEVFDNVGRLVATLVHEKQDGGFYQEQFDASGYGSGMYLCRLTAGHTVLTNKLVYLK
jgi:hypothetical protein